MKKSLLLVLVLASTSAFAKEKLQCDFTRTDGKIESIVIQLHDDTQQFNFTEVAGKQFGQLDFDLYATATESGTGDLGSLKVDYSYAWGSTSCEECRTGATKTAREHLFISKDGQKVEFINNLYTSFDGEATKLSSTPGYSSVICFEPK